MNRKQNPLPEMLSRLPLRWAVGLVFIVIGYGLLQPVLKSKLGIPLPSLASLTNSEARMAEPPDESRQPPNPDARPSGSADDNNRSSRDSQESSEDSRTESTQNNQELKHGFLRVVSDNRYLSPAGIRYGPGSNEGHRLKHLERHLKDISDRPGRHGVFYGDMTQVLRWVDSTFERADANETGTLNKQEGDRTRYEATFDKPIGYVGGREGKRLGNPDAKKLRLILEGDQFITAFPF